MRDGSFATVGFVAAAGVWMPGARAETITLAASKDAMIFGTSAGADTSNASGKGPVLLAGADGSGNRKRSLAAFDVEAAGIPAGATVEDVTLTLYLAQVAGSGGGGGGGGGNYPSRTLRLFPLLQDWGEGPSGSPTSPGVGGTGQGYPRATGDATWDYGPSVSIPRSLECQHSKVGSMAGKTCG